MVPLDCIELTAVVLQDFDFIRCLWALWREIEEKSEKLKIKKKTECFAKFIDGGNSGINMMWCSDAPNMVIHIQ